MKKFSWKCNELILHRGLIVNIISIVQWVVDWRLYLCENLSGIEKSLKDDITLSVNNSSLKVERFLLKV